jgi:predicted O-methyltransferase YrrM
MPVDRPDVTQPDRAALPTALLACLASGGLPLGALPPDPPAAVLAELAAIALHDSRATPTDPVAPEVGRLLYDLAVAVGSRRALELGTSAGAAALWLGAAMARTGGRLLTLERDSARATLARRHLHAAGLDAHVELLLGDAGRLIGRLASRYDLVLFDEAVTEREGHFLALLPHLAPRALVLSHGARSEPAALARFNALLRSHPSLRANATLALGAGLDVAVARGGKG